MTGRTTREHIVAAADRLFYQKGYQRTSFADIAGAVSISRGNFYHHFRTKDEILESVIAARLAATRQMLVRWEAESEHPADRIRSFIHVLLTNRTKIKRYGCPVGTLCTELAKLGHGSRAEANQLLELFRDWLRHQFVQLGRERDADELALHVLARSQGVATLANALRDDAFVEREVEQMCQWLKPYEKGGRDG
jgi:AcrR family transcriptional regulator